MGGVKPPADPTDVEDVSAAILRSRPATRAAARPSFRSDIAGLRGVAVGLVVLYHAGVPGLRGGFVGVDVFFVVSGFLMTTLLLGEHARTGSIRVLDFYARRARRLLPMAVVVLVATLLATRLFVPPLLWPDVSHVARAAAVGLGNEQLARDGVDYLASDSPSPLQHYWSLGVEEQFYVLWPVALLVLARCGRRVTTVSVAALTALSFAWGLWRVGRVAPAAFFGLPSRAWELGVGALCALVLLGARHRRRRHGPTVSWAGLVAIVAGAVLIGDDVAFPGWIALVPVLGTAALLLGGASSDGPVVLGSRPAQWVGRVSYSLYLWHWPLLVLPVLVTGDALGPGERAALVVLAVGLAEVSERWVERPFRRVVVLGRWPTLAGAAVVVATTLVASVGLGRLPTLSVPVEVPAHTAATVGVGGSVVPANATPPLLGVAADLPAVYGNGCHLTFFDTTVRPCDFGDVGGSRRAMLLGDSHAAQWFPALDEAARRDGWALTALTKSSCPMVDAAVRSEKLVRPYTECETWKQGVLARVWAQRPQVVVLAAYSTAYRGVLIGDADVEGGWSDAEASMIRRLPPGTRVVVLGDGPSWTRPPSICLSGHLDDAASCARPPRDLVDEGMAVAEARGAQEAGARYVPTLPWVCTSTCSAIQGDVVLYRDRSHLTATFARLLAPRLQAEVLGP